MRVRFRKDKGCWMEKQAFYGRFIEFLAYLSAFYPLNLYI
jgi:hypothetical protein